MLGVRRRVWLLGLAVAIAVAAANQTIEYAISAAECAVHAQYEQILCLDAPSPLTLPMLGVAIVVLSVAIGIELASGRHRSVGAPLSPPAEERQ